MNDEPNPGVVGPDCIRKMDLMELRPPLDTGDMCSEINQLQKLLRSIRATLLPVYNLDNLC